jgi:hypothetical protein
MSVRQRWYVSGQIFGMRYNFPRAGDALKRHAHEPALRHNVIVLLGSVSVNGNAYAVGDIVELGAEEHDVTALVDDTTTLHLYYNGMPAGYAELPESERDVEIP